MSAFWARRIRWALRAAHTPEMWPVYPLTPATRRAFDRAFSAWSRRVWRGQ